MLADIGRALLPPTDSPPPSAPDMTDTGLICLLILARFYDLPADGSQLRHQFAQSGQLLSDADLLRAAKHLGLKTGVLTADWNKLGGIPPPAVAKRKDCRYAVITTASHFELTNGLSAVARARENLVNALFHLNAARVNLARSTGSLNRLS